MTEVFCPWVIKRRAQTRNVTYEQLAEACGASVGTINRWIKNNTTPADVLPHIAKALSCRVADFFDTVPDDVCE